MLLILLSLTLFSQVKHFYGILVFALASEKACSMHFCLNVKVYVYKKYERKLGSVWFLYVCFSVLGYVYGVLTEESQESIRNSELAIKCNKRIWFFWVSQKSSTCFATLLTGDYICCSCLCLFLRSQSSIV